MTKEEVEKWIGVAKWAYEHDRAATLNHAELYQLCELAMKGLSTPPEAADTKRLDWLEKHRATVYRSEAGHWVVVDETSIGRFGRIGKTLREAADDALSSSPPQTREEPK